MQYKVLNTNILVELIQNEEEGIVSAVEDNIIKGRVTEIGNGFNYDGKIIPLQVRPDSLVWFFKADATKMPFKENTYLLDQDDILAIEED